MVLGYQLISQLHRRFLVGMNGFSIFRLRSSEISSSYIEGKCHANSNKAFKTQGQIKSLNLPICFKQYIQSARCNFKKLKKWRNKGNLGTNWQKCVQVTCAIYTPCKYSQVISQKERTNCSTISWTSCIYSLTVVRRRAVRSISN